MNALMVNSLSNRPRVGSRSKKPGRFLKKGIKGRTGKGELKSQGVKGKKTLLLRGGVDGAPKSQ